MTIHHPGVSQSHPFEPHLCARRWSCILFLTENLTELDATTLALIHLSFNSVLAG